jgi:hypothetical protein
MNSLDLVESFLPDDITSVISKVKLMDPLMRIIKRSSELVDSGEKAFHDGQDHKLKKSANYTALTRTFGLVGALYEQYPDREERHAFLIDVLGDKAQNIELATLMAVYQNCGGKAQTMNPFTESGRMNLIADFTKTRKAIKKQVEAHATSESSDGWE